MGNLILSDLICINVGCMDENVNFRSLRGNHAIKFIYLCEVQYSVAKIWISFQILS